jgi:hypothetical protein
MSTEHTPGRSSTDILIMELRILAEGLHTGDGVAEAALLEAADRLQELDSSLAAAPEMLEALKMLYALVQGECPSLLSDDSGGDVRCAIMVEAAIAKAEWRQP